MDMNRGKAELTPDMARALGLLPDDDTQTTAPPRIERGVVSAAISASRRRFKYARGVQQGENFGILVEWKSPANYDYLLVTPDTARLIHVEHSVEKTLTETAIEMTTKERIDLCSLRLG